MRDQYSIAEARNKLPSIVHAVEKGASVKLTRHGRPVAVLMSLKHYEKLNREKGSYWEAVKHFRHIVGKEGVQITDADFEGIRDKSYGRKVEL